MSSQKYIYNPLTQELEERSNPSPHVSSKKPTAGAVYTSKLDQVAYPKAGTSPGEIVAAKKLSNKDRRKKTLMKAWGLEDPKDPPVTSADWKNETPRYRKHLADIIAGDQQTIFYNKDTGGWRDKWDQERKPEEVLTEQNEIQKRYDSIFTPKEQEEYQESLIKPVQRKRNEFQKKKMDNYNKTVSPIGTIKNLDNPKQKSNSWNDLKAGKITKITKDNTPGTFDIMVKAADKEELEKLKKDYPDYPKFKLERLQKDRPIEDNSKMIHEMEQLAKMRLQQDINSQEFKKIMTTPEDPDLAKGINSLPGNEPMKKEFTKLPKFRNRSQRIRHARNTLGIGPHLTGEND